MSLSVIILAAGKGTRMRSQTPKVLHELAGKPLLKHVIDTALTLNPRDIFVVVGHGGDEVKTRLAAEPVQWVEQPEQKGTGHAVQQALPSVTSSDSVLILYGDVPLTTSDTLQQLVDGLQTASLCLLTMALENPHGYGRILRDTAGALQAIVEEKDASEAQRKIDEVNTGIMAVEAKHLRVLLADLDCDNAQSEYLLTDIIAGGHAVNLAMNSATVEDIDSVSGVNDRVQLATLERRYQQQQANELLVAGVTLADPQRVDIRGKTSIGRDSFVDINCLFIGDNSIGDNVSIGPNCIIANSTIADNTVIQSHCVIENAEIGLNCVLGPFARLRPGTVMREAAKLGNFVETKNSEIGVGSKVSHLSYVGDSELAEGVNIGAGVITANYDGANKFKTRIEQNAFVGSNTVLVAPLTVGTGATIGAGSTVTRDVDDKELVLTRADLKSVPNWQRPQKKK